MTCRRGDTVRVTYEGTVHEDETITRKLRITDPGGNIHYYSPADVSVEKIQPKVELGDLWRGDDGLVYIAVYTFANSGLLLRRITNNAGASETVKGFFKKFPEASLLFRPSNHGIEVK